MKNHFGTFSPVQPFANVVHRPKFQDKIRQRRYLAELKRKEKVRKKSLFTIKEQVLGEVKVIQPSRWSKVKRWMKNIWRKT